MSKFTRTAAAALAAGLCLAALPAAARHHDPQFFAPPNAGDRQLPFSEAGQAGPFLFLSGMLANVPEVRQLASSGRLAVDEAVVGILLAYSFNGVMKVVVSWVSGKATFAMRVLPGQVLMVGLAWLGWALAYWGLL